MSTIQVRPIPQGTGKPPIYKFSLSFPGAGTYAYSGITTTDIGTIWANPLDHSAFFGLPIYDFKNGCQFSVFNQGKLVSLNAPGSFAGPTSITLSLDGVDQFGAVIASNIGALGFNSFNLSYDYATDISQFGGSFGGLAPGFVPFNGIKGTITSGPGSGGTATVLVPTTFFFLGG